MTDHDAPNRHTHLANHSFVEDVEVQGHIIDSLLLPKVLDIINARGGSFHIKQITIGQERVDPSFALVEVRAGSLERLNEIVAQISDHGAAPVASQDCHLTKCDQDGVFPEGFYSSTNQRTEIRLDGNWVPVSEQEMDCGIVVHGDGKANCIAMSDVTRGQRIVVGHAGVRVFPEQRAQDTRGFEFMNSAVSTEKPKSVAIRQVARQLFEAKQRGQKSLVVGGPAIVHTGSGPHLCRLIRTGYVQRLFAGNALAVHDIEQSIFGTSLGVDLGEGDIIEAGHEHHLRAINRIRRAGGIANAVEQGILDSGIMYECVRNQVDFLLAGSIRDDGPLPDVITDAIEAQRQMRQGIRDIQFCLMIATTLHSIAVGNLLPASVDVVCVDINPSTVIKLSDRGSFQTIGIVTDVEPFMRALVGEIESLERA